MKRLFIFSFLVLSFLIGGASHISAMKCETPPFITRVVMPNILIILDHSGSMLDDDAGTPYDPSKKYEPWVGMPDLGNYENWYNYNRTRWQIAKNVVTHIIDETESVRFGLIRLDGSDSKGRSSRWNWEDPRTGGRFNTDTNFLRHGGKLLRPVGTEKGDLIDYINGMEVYDTVPHTYTVLAETLFTAAQYFAGGKGPPGLGEYKGDSGDTNYKYYKGSKSYWAKDTDDYGNPIDNSSPIEHWCQRNFVIFMTDGESNCDSDWDRLLSTVGDHDHDGKDTPHAKPDFPPWEDRELHNYLDDVAQWMYENDMRSDMEGPDWEIQNVITYTIGFRIDMKLLEEAAIQGGGLYFTADDYEQLKAAFEGVLADIIKKTSSGTAASIISTAQQTGNRLFRAKFDPQTWGGFLEAFSLPFDSGSPNPVWEGSADGPSSLRYRSPATRRIYTALDDEPGIGVKMVRRVEFTAPNSDVTDADNIPLYQILGFSDRVEAGDLINYIRGEDFDKFRERKYKLGDIVYSTPAVTKYTVYVGANDGMLHAFDLNTGMERWAFIPNNLLGKLKDLARKDYCHEYFVDLSPVVARIRVGTESRTILICGERGGGDAYFAVDVTGDDPIPLWEFSEGELGESWSIPYIGGIKIGENGGKLAVFFGSGFENKPTNGNLYAIDIEEGNIIGKVELKASPGDPLNSPRAIDSDDDGFLDFLYAGDLGGRVFKVQLDPDPARWLKKLLFTTESGQPISIPMSLTFYDADPNHLFVYFGTGKYYTVDDRSDPTTQSFYAIKDNGAPVERGNLANQTTGCQPAEELQGWYIDFIENSGERVTASPLVAGGIVFFTTFEPDIKDPCKCGGIARLYAVQYDTGCTPDSPVLDVNGDGIVDQGDMVEGTVPRSIIIGHGLPSDIIFNPTDSQIIIQTSDTTVHAITVRLLGERIHIHTWRQVIH